ncbi:classical arabinogalactan protein 9-like [Penaeus monodon]|uniref:classical arabinogalactan protein 9-like n=1 Tax=Penaeus monodon TaxID=6687 RepID=UPI0018A7242B|nr:classical arabinogalactan protein 9-like [Penaeus monodon]
MDLRGKMFCDTTKGFPSLLPKPKGPPFGTPKPPSCLKEAYRRLTCPRLSKPFSVTLVSTDAPRTQKKWISRPSSIPPLNGPPVLTPTPTVDTHTSPKKGRAAPFATPDGRSKPLAFASRNLTKPRELLRPTSRPSPSSGLSNLRESFRLLPLLRSSPT